MMEFSTGGVDIAQTVRDFLARAHKYPAIPNPRRVLKVGGIETSAGVMLAMGDDDGLCLLAYADQPNLERKAAVIQKKLQALLETGQSASIRSAEKELREYFARERKTFETPLVLVGSTFQVLVWEELRKVPFGETIPYVELARRLGRPSAFRAVAQSTAQTAVEIMVPSHRVLNTDGGPGGYTPGISRKQWLLDFERGASAGTAEGTDSHG